ncbi:MAG: hypothetical protein ACK4F4_06825 [Hylemonella sp.]|jgi:hypothetical protein|uniref:hypothetical protein n=1 Tax=Hylemonella sp. TaxID=2066020 RepID=UPI00391A9DA5
MFGLFKQKPPPPSPTPFGAEPLTDLGARRMNLDERKQVRREMVYQSVRDNLLLLEIISGMYKFKAVGLDERQHRFMVVIDVATGFVARRGGKVLRFNEVEKFLSERTFAQYGVRIDSIYWRFHPDVNSFGRGYRASDVAPKPRPAPIPTPPPAAPARPAGTGLRPSSRHEPVSEEEMRAFEQAIARGVKPPPLHLGDLEYQSDLAPLESPPVAGGTQYGSL